MLNNDKFIEDIFSGPIPGFNDMALRLFRYQAEHNAVYSKFLQLLHIHPENITSPEKIPFLPVEFFKTHQVTTGSFHEEIVFTSSGTTGGATSNHFIASVQIYQKSYRRCFELFLGKPADYIVAALLPSYTERKSSSLIYMVNDLIRMSEDADSGFIQPNQDSGSKIKILNDKASYAGKKLLLIGVSFALLEVCEKHPLHLDHTVILETGGMKGRKKEITREELHTQIRQQLNPHAIYSEYGMTELLSQAYTTHGKTSFHTPPWMKILIRDPNDPFSIFPILKQGAINIIDLANIYSCSFLATSDMGRVLNDGTFEVAGRIDHSDLRGCNLMYF